MRRRDDGREPGTMLSARGNGSVIDGGPGPSPGEATPSRAGWREALGQHWPEFLIEGVCLGLFMASACAFGTLIWHPASPIGELIPVASHQRLLMGTAMGLTAVALIYSKMGKRSGAHMNPSTTLAFLRLGKVAPWDACFYVLAQFAGATSGVGISRLILGQALADPPVRYLVTVPGASGALPAFSAELIIAFLLMTAILHLSGTPELNRYTGLVAGGLLVLYIWIEAPLSGMSLNPARSLASAVPAFEWTSLWIYFSAPPAGMLLAAEVYRWRHAPGAVLCAKLHHENDQRCIFHCNYPAR